MRNTRIVILVEVALAIALCAVLNLFEFRSPLHVLGGSVSLVMLPIAVVALRRGALAGMTCGAVFGIIDLISKPLPLHPLSYVMDYPLPYLLFGLGVGIFAGIYNRVMQGKRAATDDNDVEVVRDNKFVQTTTGTTMQDTKGIGDTKSIGAQKTSDAANKLGAAIAISSLALIAAVLVGGIMRLACHTVSGVILFSSSAAEFFVDNPGLLLPGAVDSGLNVWIFSTIYNATYLVPSLVFVIIGVLVITPILAKALPIAQKVKAKKATSKTV